jgi:hypothetical protein
VSDAGLLGIRAHLVRAIDGAAIASQFAAAFTARSNGPPLTGGCG